MSSQMSWNRVRQAARQLAQRSAAAAADWSAGLAAEPLPDVAVLEDRILFSAAPADGAMLDPAEGTGAGAETPLAEMQSDLYAASAEPLAEGSLLAEDRYISVNPEDRIIANYGIGAGGKIPQNRYVGGGLVQDGWGPYVENQLQWAVDSGFKRISVHMPFGHRTYVVDPVTGEVSAAPGETHYQFDAYLDAQEQIPKVTETFVPVFKEFIEENTASGKLTDAIVYIGSPRLDPDQLALIDDPDAWWNRAYQIITPLLDAGFRSIAFDASAPATPDVLDFDLHEVLRNPELRDPVRDAPLIDAVGDEPIEVYLEAVPYRTTGRTDFPLMLLDWGWERQDPDLPGPHQDTRKERFFEHDQFTAEIVRMVRHEQWQTLGLEPLEKILLEGHTVAIPDALALYPNLFGSQTLEQLIDRLDLPSLPTLVDLDPDDVNPEATEYEIVAGPKFGTLTSNRFHEDVYTYRPNPNFTGVDSFEYLVRDSSGATATAVVKFFVNTEVVVPGEPEPPSTPPGGGDPPPGPGPVEPPETPDPPEEPEPPEVPGPTTPPPVDPEPPHEEPPGGSPPPVVPSPPESSYIDSVLPFARSPRAGLSPVAPELPVSSGPSSDSVSPPSALAEDGQGDVELERVLHSTDASDAGDNEAADAEPISSSTTHSDVDAADDITAAAAGGQVPPEDAGGNGFAVRHPQFAAGSKDSNSRDGNWTASSSSQSAVRQPSPEITDRPHGSRSEDETLAAWYDRLSKTDADETAELEGAGFVAGVFALERFAHAAAPAAGSGKGSSVLQFLSEVRNWLSRR